MAASALSAANRQDPPRLLTGRTARVATVVMNTVRVPHDRFHDEKANWYKVDGIMPKFVEGNQVKYMIDGADAFPEMVAAIKTATGAGHFIYMINWFCDLDFNLVPETTLKALLLQTKGKGVMVRAMLWKPPPEMHQNDEAVNFLNGVTRQVTITPAGPSVTTRRNPDALDNSAAIHDNRGNEPIASSTIPIFGPIIGGIPRAIGSQHQKILCVNGEQGLVCFVGGIDFNPDRISNPDGKPEVHGQPLHDVHCRIIGPAALELVNVFVQKWNDHPQGRAVNADPKRGPLITASSLGTPPTKGDHIVQVGRTYPPKGIYSFRPEGEQTAAGMTLQAIRNAKKFIYTECQYFVGTPQLQDALIKALPNIEHFTAVITHWEISDLPMVNAHRWKFIQQLKRAGGDKVRIFTLQPGGINSKAFQKGHIWHTYVHAKIWIVDDTFAVIGTVNSNRRSWTHDSEAAAGIYETSTDRVLRFRLAHWLRTEIWQEHLNMNTVEANAELADGVASAVHWSPPPADARVARYHSGQKNDAGQNDQPLPVISQMPILGVPLTAGLKDLVWDDALDPQYPVRPEAS